MSGGHDILEIDGVGHRFGGFTCCAASRFRFPTAA